MLYWAIIIIVILEFSFGITLSVLNRKASHNPIPGRLQGLYDEETYKRQQAYSRENARIGLISGTLDTCILLGMFAFGGFCLIDSFARSVSSNSIVITLIFMGIWYIISWVIDIPFSVYDVFRIEQKYGFNRTTPKTFVTDQLKDLVLTAVMMGGILSLLVWIYELIPGIFWIVAWAAITLVMLFFQFFYSDIIVPLFNKQTPLEEGELRTAIEAFASKVGFKLNNIYVIDGSKRSSKANAYFTGFGSKKRIVLYDTLMEQLTTEEIVAVLAHEIGHYKKGHIVKGIISSLLSTLVTLYLFSLVIDSKDIAMAAGCEEASVHVNLTVFSLLLTPIQIVIGLVGNVISRRHEWEADEFARIHGFGTALASSLRKMSKQSLSNLTPHPWVVFVKYSHPTLLQRIEHVEEL